MKSSIQLKTTKVFEHLDTSNKRIIVEQGGTRSGKTYNILIWIIFKYCMIHSNKIVTICRKHGPSLRGSSMRDFFTLLEENDLYSEERHSKSLNEYKLNNNLVEFVSLDEPQKIRGRKRDLLFINEGNELTKEDFFQLNIRTTSRIIIDYNPSDEYHWIYDDIIDREDCDFHITTYLDNPFLDPVLIEEIERLKHTDELYWQIYGKGQRGSSKAIIFTTTVCNTIPEQAKFISYGLDFGYSNDPTAMVGIWVEDLNIYIKEYLYRTMMTARDIHIMFKEIGINREMIFGDSAEPRLIDELRRMGWNVRPSIKGRDSVNAGIDLLKRYKLNILSDSDNAIQEFRNYKWIEDRSGKLTNVPEDKNNHIIDAVRYGTYSIISKPTFGKYTVM